MEEKDKLIKQLADDYNEAIAEIRFNMSTIGLKENSVKRVVKARDLAIKALEEVQQYREIGTLEECRTAVEQTTKKPIFSHNLSDTLSVFHCECGNTIKVSHDIGIMNNNNAPNYCNKCGCRLDWSDEG